MQGELCAQTDKLLCPMPKNGQGRSEKLSSLTFKLNNIHVILTNTIYNNVRGRDLLNSEVKRS